MSINAYLFFGGDCAEALTLYAELMGGKIEMMLRYSEAPDGEDIPAGTENMVMHAYMTIGGVGIMASDAPGEHDTPQGFAISYTAKDDADAEKVFTGLSEGGTVDHALIETFFATKFGSVTDRFGTPWMVIAERPMEG